MLAATMLTSLGACNDTAVVIRVSSDRGIGVGAAQLAAICVELDAGGAARFGRRYDLAARPLPQTLTALAGGRDAVQVIVRGLQSGVEAARARALVPFRSGEILHLE